MKSVVASWALYLRSYVVKSRVESHVYLATSGLLSAT